MKHLDIKRALADHGLNQAKLCRKIGVLTQNMNSIINGNPTVNKLMMVAEGIGCDVTDLFYDDEPSAASQGTSGNASSASPSASSSEGSQSSPSSSTSPQGEQGDIIAEGDPFRSKINMHVGRMDFSQDPTPSPDVMQTTTFCPHCGKRVRVGVVLMAE